MVKNSPQVLQKIVENLLIDLEQYQDCSEWECEECPLWLKHIEDDSRYGRHACGWLLLKSATRKIMMK